MSKIMVCIPANNEEASIARTVQIIDAGLTKHYANEERLIVLADNGSYDDTLTAFDEVKCLSGKHIISRTGLGKGSNMKAGLALAVEYGADSLTFIDADLQSLSSDWLPRLVDPVLSEKVDFLGPHYKTSQGGPLRHLLSRVFAAGLFAVDLPQPTGGEVSLTKSLIAKLADCSSSMPNDYGIDLSLVATARLLTDSFGYVNLGSKIHRARPWHTIGHIVEQVAGEGLRQVAANGYVWREMTEVLVSKECDNFVNRALPNAVNTLAPIDLQRLNTNSLLISDTARELADEINLSGLPADLADLVEKAVSSRSGISDAVYINSLVQVVREVELARLAVMEAKKVITVLFFLRLAIFLEEVEHKSVETLELETTQRVAKFRKAMDIHT